MNLPTVAFRPLASGARIAGLLLWAAGLVACESTASKTTTPDQRAAATPIQVEEYAKLGYRVEWRGFPSLTPGGSIRRLEVFDDVVAVQDSGGTLSILEQKSGERRWSDPVDNPLTRFVGINRDGKRIIVSSEAQAYFYDVDTGALLTKQKLDAVANTRPVQVAEILVYGCTNGQVLGHLMLNGFRQWATTARGAIATDPVLIGNTGLVAVLSEGGDVLLVDGLTGSLRGGARIFGGSDAPLGASDSALFVASRDQSLYAFSAEDGREMWRVRTEAPLRFAPFADKGVVYCDMGQTGLTAFDAAAGKQKWSARDVHGAVVAIRAGRLIVWDGRNATVIEPNRGGVVETVELKETTMVHASQREDGDLYLTSRAGVVTKLSPRK